MRFVGALIELLARRVGEMTGGAGVEILRHVRAEVMGERLLVGGARVRGERNKAECAKREKDARHGEILRQNPWESLCSSQGLASRFLFSGKLVDERSVLRRAQSLPKHGKNL